MHEDKTSSGYTTAHKLKKKRTSTGCLIRILIGIGAVAAILALPIFRVGEIYVAGNQRVQTQSVINASGIYQGQHVLRINYKEAKQYVERMSYVKEAQIKYHFPNKIEITVQEDQLAAYLTFAGGYVGINGEGKVLETVPEPTEQVPIITGVKINNFLNGEKITIDETEKFDIILLSISELNHLDLQSQIASIYIDDKNYIFMETRGNLYVKVGDNNDVAYKLAMLKEALASLPEGAGGSIDLSTPGKAVYSTER